MNQYGLVEYTDAGRRAITLMIGVIGSKLTPERSLLDILTLLFTHRWSFAENIPYN